MGAINKSPGCPHQPETIEQSFPVYAASVVAPPTQVKPVLDELKLSTCDQVGWSLRQTFAVVDGAVDFRLKFTP